MSRTPTLNPKPKTRPGLRIVLFLAVVTSATFAFVIGLSVLVLVTRG